MLSTLYGDRTTTK